MDFQKGKDFLNALMSNKGAKDSYGNWYNLKDNSILSKSYVCACAYEGRKTEKFYGKADAPPVLLSANSQVCHAHIVYLDHTIDVMYDHIQGGTREGVNQTFDESVTYLQYFMDHPIFKHSFFEHDAKKAMEERIMVRDLGSLPSNVTMFCIIACRALWENGQNRIVHTFNELLKFGLNPDFAFIMSYFVKCMPCSEGIVWTVSPIVDSGHTALPTAKISVIAVSNYLNHKTVIHAKGTLKDQHPYYEPAGANVYSVFEPAVISVYGAGSKNGELFLEMVKEYATAMKSQPAETLKEIQEKFHVN